MKVWHLVRRAVAKIQESIGGGDKWQEVHASPGLRPEPTLRRFSYLRSKGIRCRLGNLAAPAPQSGGFTGMVSLRVHKDDVGIAYSLLAEVRD